MAAKLIAFFLALALYGCATTREDLRPEKRPAAAQIVKTMVYEVIRAANGKQTVSMYYVGLTEAGTFTICEEMACNNERERKYLNAFAFDLPVYEEVKPSSSYTVLLKGRTTQEFVCQRSSYSKDGQVTLFNEECKASGAVISSLQYKVSADDIPTLIRGKLGKGVISVKRLR